MLLYLANEVLLSGGGASSSGGGDSVLRERATIEQGRDSISSAGMLLKIIMP